MLPNSAHAPYVLVLNAAEGLLQFLIARQEADGAFTRLCMQAWHAPSQGAELLAPALDEACKRLGIPLRDIGRIAVVRGPGSFTGLRLVLATAAGLARATRALLAGLDYLPLLALSALQSLPETAVPASLAPAPPRRLWTLTHARRDLIHAQAFEDDRPLSEIFVCTPLEAAGRIAFSAHECQKACAQPPLLLGSGLRRNSEALAKALQAEMAKYPDAPPCAPLPPLFDHPCAEALLLAAASAVYSRQDITPLYVRPPDAADNLEGIAASLGLDPEAAKKRFAELTEGTSNPPEGLVSQS